VVESHPFVIRPPLPFVIPKRPERPIRLQLPHCVGPALSQRSCKRLSALSLNQRVVEGLCWIDVFRSRYDIVFPSQHHRYAGCQELDAVDNESLKPDQLQLAVDSQPVPGCCKDVSPKYNRHSKTYSATQPITPGVHLTVPQLRRDIGCIVCV